jgi:alpha-ketoglutarate-dependent taurine dioxygenase
VDLITTTPFLPITTQSKQLSPLPSFIYIALTQKETVWWCNNVPYKMAVKTLAVNPLSASYPDSAVDFGVEIDNIDLEALTDAEFEVIRNALYISHVVVLRNQSGLSPKAQYELTKRFDPTTDSYGHGKTLDAKRSVLHPDLKTIPHQPQVQVIGNGFYEEYEGLKNITLVHPHHKKFHKVAIAEEDDLAATRFFRWHIDAALYALNPPKVTSLMAVKVPAGRRQTLRYDDGSGEEMEVPLGTTAFVSGQNMYNLLSEEDKKFVREAKVEYAPHPYIWMSPARSRSNGLGMVSEGVELPLNELPPVEEEKVKILPMCWKNPVTGNLALQIHPSAIKAIHLPDGEVMTNLEEVRELVYRLQRPAISPRYVYAHDWKEGDCVLFNNQGVLHSVVGAFRPEEKRLFRQCNMASSEGITGPEGKLY